MYENSHTTRDRGLTVLGHLPPGPFTMEEFVAARHSACLIAVERFDDIARILHYLIKNELIRRLDETPSHPSQWVCTQS